MLLTDSLTYIYGPWLFNRDDLHFFGLFCGVLVKDIDRRIWRIIEYCLNDRVLAQVLDILFCCDDINACGQDTEQKRSESDTSEYAIPIRVFD
jgi:hypothetical protein